MNIKSLLQKTERKKGIWTEEERSEEGNDGGKLQSSLLGNGVQEVRETDFILSRYSPSRKQLGALNYK